MDNNLKKRVVETMLNSVNINQNYSYSDYSVELIEDMIEDIHIATSLEKLKRNVAGREWSIVANDESLEKRSKELEESFAALNMNKIMKDIFNITIFGYGAFEIVWNEEFNIEDLVHIPQKYLTYQNKKWYMTISGTNEKIEDGNKFLILNHNAEIDEKMGKSSLIPCIKSYEDKVSIRGKMRSIAEKYGDVIVIFGYDEQEDDETIKQRKEKVEDMAGGKSTLGVPMADGQKLKDWMEFIKLSDLETTVQNELEDRWRREIQQYILGADYSESGSTTGSEARDKIQQEEQEKVEDEKCKYIRDSLQKLLELHSQFYGYNANDFYFKFEKERDQTEEAELEGKKKSNFKTGVEALNVLSQAGYELTDEYVAKSLGIPVEALKKKVVKLEEFAESGVVAKKKAMNKQKVLSYKEKTAEVEEIFSGGIREQIEKQLKKAESVEDLTKIELNLEFLEDSMILGMLQGVVDEDDIANASVITEFADEGNIYNNNFSAAIDFFLSKKPELYEKIEPITLEVRSNFHWIKKSTELETTKKLIDSLGKALETGNDFRGWKKNSKEILEKTGFGDNSWYLNNVYRTNTISAYSAGRYTQQEELKDTFPYWLYDAVDDKRTTLLCSSLDDRVYRADDEFWNNYYPPNHYQCRSSVIALTKDEVKAEGLKVSKMSSGDTGNELKTFKGNPAKMWKNAEKSVKLKEVVVAEKVKEVLLDLSAIEDEGMREVYERAFKNSPESIRTIVSKNIGEAGKFIYDGGYYQSYGKIISIGKGKGNHVVAAHEFGHFVDNVLGELVNGMKHTYISANPFEETYSGFYNAVEDAIKGLSRSKANIAKRKALKGEVTERIGQANLYKKEYAALQDIINGVTKGKVKLPWGHGDSYWKQAGAVHKETFAQLFTIYSEVDIAASKLQKEYIKELFPDMIIEFEKILTEFSK